MKTDILMVGVGGQGIVLASNIVCDVALLAGYDVKKSEIHGMAQRGGSVTSHVRIAESVHSPVISFGQADIVLSFERMEFLRYLEYINPTSKLIVSTQRILPPGVASGVEAYPDALADGERARFAEAIEVDALGMATKAGTAKAAGMPILGQLAKMLPFERKHWETAISEGVPPKTIDVNLKAFAAGFEYQG